MWSRISLWICPFIKAVKEKVTLFIKFISPTVNQDLSACPSLQRSFRCTEKTPTSFLANVFKSFSQTTEPDLERGTFPLSVPLPDEPDEDETPHRFSRPKKWVGVRVEPKRQTCTTIPSFFAAEASAEDDEWHIRYRRDVLGIVSPPTLLCPRLPSATLLLEPETTLDISAPLANSDEDHCSFSFDNNDMSDESDISDEIITPSTSSDSPLVIQIFTPRISNTPTIDNLAMGLHTQFTPDGVKKPLPIDTDPYDLMAHLFGDEFTRMDQGCLAKIMATKEVFSIPTASFGLAIELALSNENVLADIPWVPARPVLGMDTLSRTSIICRASYIPRSSRPPIVLNHSTDIVTYTPSSDAAHVPFIDDFAHFIAMAEADPPIRCSGLVPVGERINAAEICTPGSAILLDAIYPSRSQLFPSFLDDDVLADLPVFLAMSERATSWEVPDDENIVVAVPTMEHSCSFLSPTTLTTDSSPELNTPPQTSELNTSPSVYSCRTLDDEIHTIHITDDAKDGINSVKFDEEFIDEALDESQDLEDDPNVVIRPKRRGIFIPVPPPPAPSRLAITSSVRQISPLIPLRGFNVKRTCRSIKRNASKPSFTGLVNTVVRAASIRPSKSLEDVRAHNATPCVQIVMDSRDPFAQINSSFYTDRYSNIFQPDVTNLDIYKAPDPKPSPHQHHGLDCVPAPECNFPESDFMDFIPTYVYDYAAISSKIDTSLPSIGPTAWTPQDSFLIDTVYGNKTANNVGPHLQSVHPQDLSNKVPSTPNNYYHASGTHKRQTTKRHTNDSFTSFSTDSAALDSPVGVSNASTPALVDCPLISISPPSVSSICLDNSVSVPVSRSSLVVPVSHSSLSAPVSYSSMSADLSANESTRFLSVSATPTNHTSMSVQHVPKLLPSFDQGNNPQPKKSHTGMQNKSNRRNFTITCPDDIDSSRRTLTEMRVNDPPLPRLLPAAPISGADDSSTSLGLPALENILVVNENYVSGLALPEGSPPRRVSAPSTCPFAAAAAAAARAAALGEIRRSGSNVPTSLRSRRQSVIHANREPHTGNKLRKRPLHIVPRPSNRSSNLKPLVLPMRLALREANEVNMRLSSKLEALESPDLSSEQFPSMSDTSLDSSRSLNTSSAAGIAAIIELLDAVDIQLHRVPPRLSNGSNNSSRRASPQWGVAF